MLCIHGVLFWKARVLIRQGYPDFTIFYTAGKMLHEGLGHNLYNGALQYEVQQTFAAGVRIRKGPLPYNHPPFEALIFEPLASLDYPTAYLVWSVINLAILGFLPFLLRQYIPALAQYPAFVWLLVLLGFFPVLVALLQGQDVILLLLLNALAFAALKRNADTLAGCWLGLSMFKFQLIVPFVLILLCWKRTRVVQSFVVTAAVLSRHLGSYYRLGGGAAVSLVCLAFRKIHGAGPDRCGHAEPARIARGLAFQRVPWRACDYHCSFYRSARVGHCERTESGAFKPTVRPTVFRGDGGGSAGQLSCISL